MQDKFNIVFNRLNQAKLSENVLCSEFWLKIIKLQKNFNEDDCWALLIDNIEWVINTGIMTTDDLVSWLLPEDLNKHNIYIEGEHEIKDAKAIGIKNARINATGHSKIILFDNAHCQAHDSCFVTGFNNTSIELKNCVADAFHSCKVLARDFSKVEAWDNSSIKAETYSSVLAHDKVQVENTENTHTVFV